MKRFLICIILSTFICSCSFTNISSYEVSETSNEDRSVIAANLEEIASQLNMENHKNKSKAQDTISLHVKPRDEENWYFEMGARRKNKNTIIDLNAGYGPKIPRYECAKKQVEGFMKKHFQGRYEKVRYEFIGREKDSAYLTTPAP